MFYGDGYDQEKAAMRIDIQGQGLPLNAALLAHTERRLRLALTRTSTRIKRVVVRLGAGTTRNPNGADMYCHLQVTLEHAPPVLIEDAGTDLYAAIDRAAARAGRNVAQRVDRQRRSGPAIAPIHPTTERDRP